MHVATYCSRRKSKSIASGWVSLTQIICPLHQLCLPASNRTSQAHNFFELKANRKLCFQSRDLWLHILALLSTAIANRRVPRNVATFATLIAHACVCLGCTTYLSLPKHHWGITANTSSLRCINWQFFKLRIEWPVHTKGHMFLFPLTTLAKIPELHSTIPNFLSSWLGIFQSTRLGAKHPYQDFTPQILFEEELCFLFRNIGATVIRQVKSGNIISHIRWVLPGMQQLLACLLHAVCRMKLHQQIAFQSVPNQYLQVITLSCKPHASLISEKLFLHI